MKAISDLASAAKQNIEHPVQQAKEIPDPVVNERRVRFRAFMTEQLGRLKAAGLNFSPNAERFNDAVTEYCRVFWAAGVQGGDEYSRARVAEAVNSWLATQADWPKPSELMRAMPLAYSRPAVQQLEKKGDPQAAREAIDSLRALLKGAGSPGAASS